MRIIALLVIATLAGACASGSDPALQTRSAAADSIILAGQTFVMVGTAMNQLCPSGQLSLEVCRGFRRFAEGVSGKACLTLADVVAGACGFQEAYPLIVKAYQGNKEPATELVSMATSMIGQLTKYAQTVNAAQGAKP